MANEALKKLYTFAEGLESKPQWVNIETKHAFVIPTELSNGSYIHIHVKQEGERLRYTVPFYTLPADSTQRTAILEHLLTMSFYSPRSISMAIDGDEIYIIFSQPVTYDDKLDTQLFIEARYNIARFYEENQESLLSFEG